MRLPQSWKDPSLLDDEPFCTEFIVRINSRRKRLEDIDWVKRTVNELRTTDGGLQAAKTWIDMAFYEITSDQTRSMPKKPGLEPGQGGLEAFVQVFWHIYENKEEEALNYLNKERGKRNFAYRFFPHDNIVVGGTPTAKKARRTQGKEESMAGLSKKRKAVDGDTDSYVLGQPELRATGEGSLSTAVEQDKRTKSCRPKTTKKPKILTVQNPPCTLPNDGRDMSGTGPRTAGAANHPKMAERVKHRKRATTKKPADVIAQLGKPTCTIPKIKRVGTKSDGAESARIKAQAEKTSTLSPSEMVPVYQTHVVEGETVMATSDEGPGTSFYTKPSQKPIMSKSRTKRQKRIRGSQAFSTEQPRSGVDDPMSRASQQSMKDSLTLHAAEKILVRSSPRAVAIHLPSSVLHARVDSVPDLLPSSTIIDTTMRDAKIGQLNVSGDHATHPATVQCELRSRSVLTEPLSCADQWNKAHPTMSQLLVLPMFSFGPDTTHVSPNSAPEASGEWAQYREDVLADPSDDEIQEPGDDNEHIDSKFSYPQSSMNQCEGWQQNKLPLPHLPPIWAQSRQELCETFDWFRSYQGGVYFSNNIVKGYLLSAFASSRDIFHHEGKLIISHGGGKAESLHTRQGQTEIHLATDQLAQDKSVRALLTNYRNRRPLVLLVDDRYALFKYDFAPKAVTYAVLGYFLITHAWAEYQPAQNDCGQVIRYKFAFQWCEDQGEPWWTTMENPSTGSTAPASLVGSSESSTLNPLPRCIPGKMENISSSELRPSKPATCYFQCGRCLEKSPHVYRQPGWMCLNPACSAFWKQKDGNAPQTQLDYTIEFLELLPAPPLPTDCKDLRPSPPASRSDNGITTDYAFSRGWHCRSCGRLSSRLKWQHWECSHCQTIFGIPGRLREVREFWGQLKKFDLRDHFLGHNTGIRPMPLKVILGVAGMIRCQTFILPEGRGQIHHIRADPRPNKEADAVFKEYQEQAADGSLAFRRWPLRAHKCRGSLLTNYFSQNTGEPYQYVGGTANTVPFSAAPSAVVKARKLIEDRVLASLGKTVSFNEVLSAAYMERQKMAFHSDSEKGLGPVVAGLSLGSAALMHFRPHAQFAPANERRKVDVTFILRHGDVLVMDGEGVQRCYEHTVAPVNFRIAATARCITPS